MKTNRFLDRNKAVTIGIDLVLDILFKTIAIITLLIFDINDEVQVIVKIMFEINMLEPTVAPLLNKKK